MKSIIKGGKKNRKYGRNKVKCERYRRQKIREKNKIKRIIQSNGLEYAIAWAKKNGVGIHGVMRAEPSVNK